MSQPNRLPYLVLQKKLDSESTTADGMQSALAELHERGYELVQMSFEGYINKVVYIGKSIR